MTTELHRCYRSERCVDYERVENVGRLGAPINATVGLCDSCERHVARALESLPRDYVDLDLALSGRTTGLAQVVAGTPEPPVPISLSVEAVQREIVHEAFCWAESTAEVIGVSWDTQQMRDTRPGFALQRACRLLSGALSVFLALRGSVHPGWAYGCSTELERDGLDGAVVLLDLRYRARNLSGQSRLISHLRMPCPRCECPALEQRDGSDTITCTACGRPYSLDEYDQLCTLRVNRWEAA